MSPLPEIPPTEALPATDIPLVTDSPLLTDVPPVLPTVPLPAAPMPMMLPMSGPLGAGQYQENQANFTQGGTWTSVTDGTASGGAYWRNDASGNTLTFQFSGTGFVIWRQVYSSAPSMVVCIDLNSDVALNASQCSTSTGTSVSNNAGTTAWQSRVFTTLAAGTHTVTLKAHASNGANTLRLDRIDIYDLSQSTVLQPGAMYEDDNAGLLFLGNWTNTTNTGAINGTHKQASGTADATSLEFRYYGTGFALYVNLPVPDANGTKTIQVCIDNLTVCTTISGDTGTWWRIPFYNDPNSPAAEHKVRIINGTHTVRLDWVEVWDAGADRTLEAGTYQENDWRLQYEGWWNHLTASQTSGGRSYSNRASGDKLTFAFEGTGFSLLRRKNTTFGDMTVCVDGIAPENCQTVSNTGALSWDTYTRTELATGVTHVVRVTSTGASTLVIDQIVISNEPPASPTPEPTPLPVLQPGRYQVEGEGLQRAGSWTLVNTGDVALSADGDQYITNTASNQTVTFKFQGTGFAVERYIFFSNDAPSFQICVDVPLNDPGCEIVANPDSYEGWKSHVISQLPQGEHTVIIKTHSTYGAASLWLDFIDIYDIVEAEVFQPGFYQETDSRFLFMGNWEPVNPFEGVTPPPVTGIYKQADLIEFASALEFKVYGTGFAIYSDVASGKTLNVWIDNIPQTVNGTGGQWWRIPFDSLTLGEHTVRIRNSSNNRVRLDWLQVWNGFPILIKGSYEELNTVSPGIPQLDFNGWVQHKVETSSGASGGYAFLNRATNDTMTFKFDGTGFGIQRRRNASNGNMEVCITDGTNPENCQLVSNQGSQGWPTVDFTVTPGVYTVTVKALNVQTLSIDMIHIYDTRPTPTPETPTPETPTPETPTPETPTPETPTPETPTPETPTPETPTPETPTPGAPVLNLDSANVSGYAPSYRIQYDENAGPKSIAATVQITDADSTMLTGATITIVGATSAEALAKNPAISIDPALFPVYANGVMNITGTASLSAYQTALSALTYNYISETPTSGPRVVTWTVTDGTYTSAPVTTIINIAALNDVPILKIGSVVSGTHHANYDTQFTEAATPVPAAAVDVVAITDLDHTQMSAAIIRLTNSQDEGQEHLAVTIPNGSLISATTSNNLLILAGIAPVSDYVTVLETLTYVNTSLNPMPGDRVITLTISDGITQSAEVTSTIHVVDLNEPPIVSLDGDSTFAEAPNFVTSFLRQSDPIRLTDDVLITDVDSSELTKATITLTNPLDYVTSSLPETLLIDTLDTTLVSHLSYDPVEDKLILTVTGTAGFDDYARVLSTLTYRNTVLLPETADRIIEITVEETRNQTTVISAAVTATIEMINLIAVPEILDLQDYECHDLQVSLTGWTVHSPVGSVIQDARGLYASGEAPIDALRKVSYSLDNAGPWSVVILANDDAQYEVFSDTAFTDPVNRTVEGRYLISSSVVGLSWKARESTETPYDVAMTPVFTHLCYKRLDSIDLAVDADDINVNGMITDYDTLTVSGTLVAKIQNKGTQNATTPFTVIFFEDMPTGRQHLYDPGIDKILAQSVQDGLDEQSSVIISAQASGTIEFAGDLVHVFVDSDEIVAETNEANNIMYVSCNLPIAPTATPAP